ncbi:hypothetical protein, partial [Candidatus Frankia alpina]|uniref:hypothetical protein n=1 Tax=Candidatus Frankia alpina TaxID=2699483 RepID=UPI001A994D6B
MNQHAKAQQSTPVAAQSARQTPPRRVAAWFNPPVVPEGEEVLTVAERAFFGVRGGSGLGNLMPATEGLVICRRT